MYLYIYKLNKIINCLVFVLFYFHFLYWYKKSYFLDNLCLNSILKYQHQNADVHKTFGLMVSEQLMEKIFFLYPICLNAGAVLTSVSLFLIDSFQLVGEIGWTAPVICVLCFVINIFFWMKTYSTDPGVIPAGRDEEQVVEISREQLPARTAEVCYKLFIFYKLISFT